MNITHIVNEKLKKIELSSAWIHAELSVHASLKNTGFINEHIKIIVNEISELANIGCFESLKLDQIKMIESRIKQA